MEGPKRFDYCITRPAPRVRPLSRFDEFIQVCLAIDHPPADLAVWEPESPINSILVESALRTSQVFSRFGGGEVPNLGATGSSPVGGTTNYKGLREIVAPSFCPGTHQVLTREKNSRNIQLPKNKKAPRGNPPGGPCCHSSINQ